MFVMSGLVMSGLVTQRLLQQLIVTGCGSDLRKSVGWLPGDAQAVHLLHVNASVRHQDLCYSCSCCTS
jgi:hypothetical protein